MQDGNRRLLMTVDAEGAQHLQVCLVGGLAGNRQPLGELAANAKRRERASGGQAKPDENDDLLVLQRPTSDGAHGGLLCFDEDTSTLGRLGSAVVGRWKAVRSFRGRICRRVWA